MLVVITAILLIFACVVTYNYIADLRRDLRSSREQLQTAESYWRVYADVSDAQRRALPPPPYSQQPTNTGTQSKPGFRLGAVGVTAINDREQRRIRDDREMRQPPFANPGVLSHHTHEDIAAAAREATNGDGLE